MFRALQVLGLITKHLPLLKKHWKLSLAGGFAAIVAYQNIYADEPISIIPLATIPYIENELSVSTTKLETLQSRYDDLVKIAEQQREVIEDLEAENAVYEKQVATYNNAVNKWKRKSNALKKRNDALQVKIDVFHGAWSSDVEHILNGKIPQTCEDAMEVLRIDSEVLKWKE